MAERARILVVDDEPAILSGIRDLLAFHGHEPTAVDNGADGLREAVEGNYDLLLLDVMLPDVDGFEICRRAREAHPSRAIMMITAKGRDEDVVEGFRAGCDDYVAKPFSVQVLAARVQSLLRRVGTDKPSVVQLGPVQVDLDNLRAQAGDTGADISPRDAEVLSFLAENSHRVVSRDDLLREVWGYPDPQAVETRCVDMHMVKLRRKLAAVLPDTELIETVRGAGYRVAAAPG